MSFGKQCKLPFPVSSSHSNSPFDLIHLDIWGPYKITTSNGCKYFLTLVDDFSRTTWNFLLPTNSMCHLLYNLSLHMLQIIFKQPLRP